MTREEAINYYKRSFAIGQSDDEKYHNEVLEFTIKALEQEPCEKVAQERYADLCEYFGGAKDILKNRKDFKAWLERVKWHIHKAEELYEKYEYKKEPCEDSISREAVLLFIEKVKESGIVNYGSLLDIATEIRNLPSVNPQPCEDAISRQAVLDLCDKSTRYDIPFEYYEGKKHIRGWDIGRIINMNKLIELPSVKPQELSRDMEEIEEVINCDADAETKCKMISNILIAKPHYFEEQEPKRG